MSAKKTAPPKTPKHPVKYCGAKNKQGNPCRKVGLKNGRCRLHGGKSLPTNKHAEKHGIYSKGFTDEELRSVDFEQIGNLDHEIMLTKIMLRRAMIKQLEVELNPDSSEHGFYLSELKRETESIPAANGQQATTKEKTTRSRKRPEYLHIIDKFVSRIGNLSQQRALLQASGAGDNAEEMADKIRATIGAIFEVTAPGSDDNQ